MKKLSVCAVILAALAAVAFWLVKSGAILIQGEREHIETSTGYAAEAKKSMEQMRRGIGETQKAAREASER